MQRPLTRLWIVLTEPPYGVYPSGQKHCWIYMLKQDANRNIHRCNVRLVAKGIFQEHGWAILSWRKAPLTRPGVLLGLMSYSAWSLTWPDFLLAIGDSLSLLVYCFGLQSLRLWFIELVAQSIDPLVYVEDITLFGSSRCLTDPTKVLLHMEFEVIDRLPCYALECMVACNPILFHNKALSGAFILYSGYLFNLQYSECIYVCVIWEKEREVS